MSQPSLSTPRLLLRPLTPGDAPIVQQLAGERDIADTTLNIPHPYEDGMAEVWIASLGPGYEAGKLATFAVVRRDGSRLIGVIGLRIDAANDKADLGYWIGKPFWNSGFATEAARAVIDWGFEALGLNRITARHLVRNPASGRVMEKAGMQHERTGREDTIKWGKYEDLKYYGIRREDRD